MRIANDFRKFVYGLARCYICYIFGIPFKMDITEQILSFIILFVVNLSFSLQLSKIYFIGLYRTLNIIHISCIVGQILAVNQGHPPPPPLKYNMSKSPFSLNETK